MWSNLVALNLITQIVCGDVIGDFQWKRTMKTELYLRFYTFTVQFQYWGHIWILTSRPTIYFLAPGFWQSYPNQSQALFKYLQGPYITFSGVIFPTLYDIVLLKWYKDCSFSYQNQLQVFDKFIIYQGVCWIATKSTLVYIYIYL